MIIGIMGSQGCGKSTVINELAKRGFLTILRKTSRSILSDWGVSLSEVNNNHNLTIKFQDEILSRKIKDDFSVKSDEIMFTERTFVDLFTYSLIALGKDNEFSDWLDQYYHGCRQAQHHYDLVIYLSRGTWDIEHDGVRGSGQHYSALVDHTMRYLLKQMNEKSNVHYIDTPVLSERIEQIEQIVYGAAMLSDFD